MQPFAAVYCLFRLWYSEDMKKMTKLAHLHHKMRTVSLFGVALFIAAVIIQAAVVGTTIWHLGFATANARVNAAFLLGVVALSGLLPPLVAFTIGERSTQTRSRYEHFYNGVLFAMLAIWVVMFISLLVSPLVAANAPAQFNTLWPAMVAIVVVLCLGLAYGKKRHQKLLHEYQPFQLALVLSLFVLVAMSMVELMGRLISPYPTAYGLAIVVPVLMQLTMVAVPYHLSKEKTMLGKLTEAAIAASVGLFAAMVGGQIPLNNRIAAMDILVPALIGMLVWVAFVYYYFYRVRDRLG